MKRLIILINLSIIALIPLKATDILFSEDFTSGDLGVMTTYDASGAQAWTYETYNSGCAKMTGYDGSNNANVDWLITTGIDMDTYNGELLSFKSAFNYASGEPPANSLNVLISTDYSGSGDPSTATWYDLTDSFDYPPGNNWTFYDAGNADISGYTGTAYIAFKYTSTTSNAPTWEIDEIEVVANVTPFSVKIVDTLYEDFEDGDLGDFYSYDNGGGAEWDNEEHAGNKYAFMNGFGAGANEDWLITPGIDMYSNTNAFFSFVSIVGYLETLDQLTIHISTDYAGSGDPSTANWSEITDSFTLSNDWWASTPSGQFDLSPYNDTVFIAFKYINPDGAAEKWEIDNVKVTAEEAQEFFTIAEIQGQATESPYKGSIVTTSGIVTAILDSTGYYIQDSTGAWSGIYVYDKDNWSSLSRGDSIQLSATVDEWDCPSAICGPSGDWTEPLTELTSVSNLQNFGNKGEPTPVSVTTNEANSEAYEGVLVETVDATCTNPDLGYGEWQVDDGSGPARIARDIYDVSGVQDSSYDITGVVEYSFNNYKILPRDSADVKFHGGGIVTTEEVTIAEIQGQQDESPYKGATIITSGIVTAIDDSDGYYLQDGSGAWNGVYVYDSDNAGSVSLGDSVKIKAQVSEFDCTPCQGVQWNEPLTELTYPSEFQILKTGDTSDIPDPVAVSTSDASGEAYEGVLIRVKDATCTAADAQYGEWDVNDGTGNTIVDDELTSFSMFLDSTYNITGIITQNFDEYKLIPRTLEDIKYASGGSVELLQLTIKEIQGEQSESPYSGMTVETYGIVTGVGSEGYFIQDSTGGWHGLYVFDDDNTPSRGDSVRVVGTIQEWPDFEDEKVTEMGALSDFEVISGGNDIPAPVQLNPADIADEQYEGVLVRIKNVECTRPIDGYGDWHVYDGADTCRISTMFYAPVATVGADYDSITGPVHYDYDNYKIVPRDENDVVFSGTIFLTNTPSQSEIDTSSFKINWTTNMNGTSEILYGTTSSLGNSQTGAGGSTDHEVTITGLTPGTIFYVKAISVAGSDTTPSNTMTFATKSKSTGEINAYFTNSVNTSYATGEEAVAVDDLTDTIIAYIEKAETKIDLALYNFGKSEIADALNTAHDNGVDIRIVADKKQSNTAHDDLDPGINIIKESLGLGEGIMHNKFMVIDPDKEDSSWVLASSANFTQSGLSSDYNNMVCIQDQSLARTFELEFNEMFGSETLTPDPAKAHFGFEKYDNTPHHFIVGDVPVEAYFSPSDQTTSKIAEVLNSADNDIEFAVFVYTRNDLSDIIIDKVNNSIPCKGIIEDTDGEYGDDYQRLKDGGVDVLSHMNIDYQLHHKYVVVDAHDYSSDPVVLTGSHNWTTAAEQVNDEYTLVIHDSTVANMYLQEFMARFGDIECDTTIIAFDDTLVTEMNTKELINPLFNDHNPAQDEISNLTITEDAKHGTIDINDYLWIYYTPDDGFTGYDSATYVVHNSWMTDTAKVIFVVEDTEDIIDEIETTSNKPLFYPNPVKSQLYIKYTAEKKGKAIIQFFNMQGRLLNSKLAYLNKGPQVINVSTNKLNKGTYIVRITTKESIYINRIIVQ